METPPANTASSALAIIADDLWVVDGVIQMPPGPLPRRMTIARLA